MNRSDSPKLTRENLNKFLARLDVDRQRAGEFYNKLHSKLVKLFECRGAPCAESLADETIDRVMQKLDQVEIHDVSLYALGVAHNVLKESWRATAKVGPLDEAPTGALAMDSNEGERRRSEEVDLTNRLECLEECIRALPAAERELVIEYYGKESGLIRHRRKLAEELGIALGTLRVQVHRIRAKLAACLDRRLGKDDSFRRAV